MFSGSTYLYDLVYFGLKDYEAEARFIARLVEERCPGARELLDVACGTGEHARLLTSLGYTVDGIDLEPDFVDLARTKNPTGQFECADMVSFDLRRTYDVVMCLFSSIGYVKTRHRLTQTLSALRRHVQPNGLVLIEPWFTPDQWDGGRVDTVVATDETKKVCRMSHSRRHGRLSVVEFHYLIGCAGQDVEYRKEVHELGLFTSQEIMDAFGEAGLAVEWDPTGPIGRGLYVGSPLAK